MKLAAKVILVFATVFLTAVTGQGTYAQTEQPWSPPFQVSDNGDTNWFPDLAAEADGTVHIIWGSSIEKEDPKSGKVDNYDYLRYRELRQNAWSPVNELQFTCVGGFTVRNSLAIAADNQLYTLVRTCTRVSAISARADAAWSAQDWSQAVTVGEGYYNALAVDSKGTLHALYNEYIPPTVGQPQLGSEIIYRWSPDGGQSWSVRADLALLPGGDERMQILVDRRDRVHVVWDHGSDWYTGLYAPEYSVYRRSDDGGATWGDQVRFMLAGESVFHVALGMGLDGNPLAVYRSTAGTNLYFQTSPDGGTSWSAPSVVPHVRTRAPNESTLDRYALATDSSNHIHLLMAGFPEGSVSARPMMLHLVWDGKSWSPPEIVQAGSKYPLWPRLVVSNGNRLHATWFTYSKASDWGERIIWYSTKPLTTSATTPADQLVRAATPSARVAAELTTIANEQPPDPRQATGGMAANGEPSQSAPPPPQVLAAGEAFLIPLLALIPVGLLLGLVVVGATRRDRREE